MAVQFIMGPAGSGKTTNVMRAIGQALEREPRKRIILLVPEQATFCYQYALINQELLGRHGRAGVLTLEILSFQRLARTMLQRTGGLARQRVDDLGKLLILRRLLQQDPAAYPFLSRSAAKPGYLVTLGEAIQELKRCQIDGARLQATLAQEALPDTLLRRKLEELTRLYGQYEVFLSQAYLDAEDVLEALLHSLERTDLLRGTDIWVDEFYDFTAQEFAVLGALMQCAANVRIVLPAREDAGVGGGFAFHRAKATLEKLRNLARAREVEILPDCVRSDTVRWQSAPELGFLEQQYFSAQGGVWTDPTPHLALVEAQNRLSEADAAARAIRRLCRERGYRYGEIGILTRGDAYTAILETVLTDYDIPYFTDHRESVRQHPLTELLLSLPDILQENWSYRSVFRFLKTGLLPFAQRELDVLENYVLRYGVRGSAWYQESDWPYGGEAEPLDALNRLRRAISAPLRRLELELEEAHTAEACIRAVYAMLEAYGVPAHLEEECRSALAEGLLETAQIDQQIWDETVQVFDQIAQLLGETPVSAAEFFSILQTAFAHLDLGLLPNSLDQVFIGALGHSRTLGRKAVFLLGANEGVFPARSAREGFFSEMERRALWELGLELGSEEEDDLCQEQFLVYLSLTRASEYLCVSYALSDEEGKVLRPSSIVERLRRLFPSLKVQTAQWPPVPGEALLPYLEHPDKAAGLLGARMTKAQPAGEQAVWAELYRWFEAHPTPLFRSVEASLRHGARLETHHLQETALYGTPLRLSVSALECYRGCPYSYFLRYGLRLEERQLYRMEAVDVGQFYHTAIEQFGRYLLREQIPWEQLDAAAVRRILDEIVEQLAPEMQNAILLSTGRYRYLRRRLQKTLERSALLLAEHGKRGDFVPVALEAGFGLADGKFPALRLTLGDGTALLLRGRIDRVEAARSGERHYLRVIDFKTGRQGLDLTEVYYGLRLQLLTYLRVALEYYRAELPRGEVLEPAGVLYYFFRDKVLRADGPLSREAAGELHAAEMKPRGLLVADMEALKLAQRDLAVGTSTLLPVSLLTKAAPYIKDTKAFRALKEPLSIFSKRSSAVVTAEQMELLLRHTEAMLRTLGEAIASGEIPVRPSRSGQNLNCRYCGYQAICQIQTVDILRHSEDLPRLEQEELWRRLRQAYGDGAAREADERGAREGGTDHAEMDGGTDNRH